MKTKKLKEKTFSRKLELKKMTISKMNLIRGGNPGADKNVSISLRRTQKK